MGEGDVSGTPVWSHDGGVCTGESYKQVVKLTFFRGAAVADPKKLFNSSLEGNTRRAIDIREGEKIDEAAQELIRSASRPTPPRAPNSCEEEVSETRNVNRSGICLFDGARSQVRRRASRVESTTTCIAAPKSS